VSHSRYSVGPSREIITHSEDGSSRVGRIHVAQEMLSWMGPFRPIVHDLLHIATAVHHIDRVAPRSRSIQRPGRNIEVRLAVVEPGQWNAVRDDLEKLLSWLTDDHWHLTFTHAETSTAQQMDWASERLDGAEEVALFSGGLDSVAGAYARLQECDRPLYLLSSLGTHVREHFLKNALEALEPSSYRWIGFRHHLTPEPGQPAPVTPNRTRGFLFLSAAAAAADALGVGTVTTYECGVGALNLPMNSAQIGAQNTRATHPHTLRQLERILQRVLQKEIRLEAPFLLRTKGELCRATGTELKRLARASNSCDETERNKTDLTEHCGVCTSCILRRVSLHAALGEADNPAHYRCHATRRNGSYQSQAFLEQARRFASMNCYGDLVSAEPSVDFAVDYLVDRTTPRLSHQEAEERILSVFKRHAIEVISFYAQHSPREFMPRPHRNAARPKNHDLFRTTG
jgi:7-cyano-7-deazaguanine synthase in queuosine biosynthesis